jgi:hypothetical protein
MRRFLHYLRIYSRRKHVRPWSLSAPIIVLLICLPILAPLRHPLKSQMSDEEQARLATVQAIVEQQTFAIDSTQYLSTRLKFRVAEVYYSDQAPTQALLLSGPYWVMYHCGLGFSDRPGNPGRPALVDYLLTLIGVTIPVAAAAGMLYRMGRLFELRRPWRAGLALAVVLGSGMVSYATVLNPYAPAAALILGAAAVLVQVSLVRSPIRSGGYLTAAGFFTALAAAIDPPAIVFTILFAAVILVMRWRLSLRIGGVLMYCIGLIPPILLHLSLSLPITGDWRLGLGPTAPQHVSVLRTQKLPSADGPQVDDGSLSGPPTFWQQVGTFTERLAAALLGSHGLLTHFPVLIFGFFGVASVMHRHWPATTKMLAIATAVGASVVLVRYVWVPVDFRWGMFSMRWYVLFLPLLLFWAGAWIRREHHPAVWATAGVLLGFSIIASLLGATDPMPRDGYRRYTVAGALSHLVTPMTADEPPALAGR